MGERVQHLKFSRTGMVRLSNYGPDPIGRIEFKFRDKPRDGGWLWRPNVSAPAHLAADLPPQRRMKDVKIALYDRHYPRKPPE